MSGLPEAGAVAVWVLPWVGTVGVVAATLLTAWRNSLAADVPERAVCPCMAKAWSLDVGRMAEVATGLQTTLLATVIVLVVSPTTMNACCPHH